MELKDLIVTPLLLFVLYFAAYKIRPKVCTAHTKKYFLPALTLKFIGAISLGLIYQYYYGGGDTFGYTTYGSHHIWEAFKDNPVTALKLLFLDNSIRPETFKYSIHMWYFDDAPAYFIVRIAGILGILTFDTYSSIALLFSVIGFSGLWALFHVLSKMYPELSLKFSIAIFFIPSVIFWGSGVMKDTITLSAIGWAVYCVYNIAVLRDRSFGLWLISIISFWVIYKVKIYILLCLIPSILVWLIIARTLRMRNYVLRMTLFPIYLAISVGLSFYSMSALGSKNDKYSFEKIAKTAEITAYDNSLWTVRKEGSGYSLGDYDFSPQGMLRKFFPAVWTTLFRPYIWESNNVVMLLSGIENLLMLFFTAYLFLKIKLGNLLKHTVKDPFIIFCLSFIISFAFAIGISSGNFGSLVRYKIPIIPFYLIALIILQSGLKKTIQTSE